MSDRRLLALDLGTTNVKAGLFGEDGALLRLASAPTPTRHPAPGWAEHDADALWACACQVLREAVDGAGGAGGAWRSPRSARPACSLDGAGEALTPIIAWYDQRSAGYAELLGGGGRRAPGLRDHRAAARRLLLRLDAALAAGPRRRRPSEGPAGGCRSRTSSQHRLTGRVATVPSLASRTMLYDQHTGDWCDELLEAAGLSRDLLPGDPRERRAGRHGDGAAPPPLTGIPAGTPVVGGGHDHICSALALRAGEERAVDSTGTAEVVVVPARAPRRARRRAQRAHRLLRRRRARPAHPLGPRRHGRRALRVGPPHALRRRALRRDPGRAGRPRRARRGCSACRRSAGPSTPHFDPESAVGTLVGLTTAHGRGDVLLGAARGRLLLAAGQPRAGRVPRRAAQRRAASRRRRRPEPGLAAAQGRRHRAVGGGRRRPGDARCCGAALLACAGAGIDADPAAAARRIGLSGAEDRARPSSATRRTTRCTRHLELGPR